MHQMIRRILRGSQEESQQFGETEHQSIEKSETIINHIGKGHSENSSLSEIDTASSKLWRKINFQKSIFLKIE